MADGTMKPCDELYNRRPWSMALPSYKHPIDPKSKHTTNRKKQEKEKFRGVVIEQK